MTTYLQATNETRPDTTLFEIQLLAQIGMRRLFNDPSVTISGYESLCGPMDNNTLTLMTVIGGIASGLPGKIVVSYLEYIKANL